MTDGNRLGEIIESYRLVRVLGSGSTSVVYLGERLDDAQAVVAIKVLTLGDAAKSTDHSTFHIRFLQEARAASKLRHDHILPVLSYGDADGVTYMVMPVVARGTIGTLLAAQKGPLPLDDVASYLLQLGSALDLAHRQGVVHRDVKPSNILLDDHGQVYLTDFGIAHIFDVGGDALTRISGAGAASLTHTGEVLGTPYYMAPEQIKSEPVGPPADVYALGVVTYQLVTGQLPFAGDTPLAVAMQHLQEEPCPPSLLRQDLPEASQNAILRALAKQPSERFASAGAFAQAFAEGLPHASEHEASISSNSTRPVLLPYSLSASPSASASDSPTLLSPGPRSSSVLVGSHGSAPVAAVSVGTHGSAPVRPGSTAMQELVGVTVGFYHLDALLDDGDYGALFAARNESGTAQYRLRLAAVKPALTPEERSLSLARFQRQAHDVAALTHPYLLSLVDYGSFRGMPYLVTPAAPGPSLAERLAQSGPLELNLAGRHLEQIAAALEFVHEHELLHRGLSPECIFLDHSGHAVVADTEVCRLLDFGGSVGAQGGAPVHLAGSSCGLAPEQLRGDALGTYTDVYGLGGLLYQMLTAHPVFNGASREEIAQQHLHVTVPPLRRWRGALPAGLETILARALAKEPSQRFRHPSELSNAYRQLISRQDSSQPFVVSPAPSVSLVREGNRLMVTDTQAASGLLARSAPKVTAPLEQPLPDQPTERPTQPRSTGEPQTTWTLPAFARKRSIQNAFFAALVLVLIGGTVGLLNGYPAKWFAHTAAPGASAVASFLDNPTGAPGNTDEVRLDVTGLTPAASGFEYDAWLADDQNEHSILLGTLAPHDANFILTYPSSGGQAGTNLLGAGDKLEVTLENGPVQAPAGTVVLVGVFPPGAFQHIQHLLVGFPTTPNKVGFLVGLLDQAQRLNDQSGRLHDDAQANDTAAVQCRAQSIVDLIEGNQGPNYKPLAPGCAAKSITETGDGFGFLPNGNNQGYLEGAADHAGYAAQSADATPLIKMHAHHIQICLSNVKGWVQTIDQDAVNLVKNPGDLSHVNAIVALGAIALNGHNLDADESIDPVPGEGGVLTAYEHGQFLATLTLTRPSK